MIKLKIDNCTLTVYPTNHDLSNKTDLRHHRGVIEWRCPECNAKNQIKIKDLPYEFAGGEDWSQVLRSAAYIERIRKISKSKNDLTSFLAEKAKIKKKYLAENFQLKCQASARIKEQCTKCGAEINLNAELSSSKQPLIKQTEIFTIDELKAKIHPEDNHETLNMLFKGYRIYLLAKKLSLKINFEATKKIGANKKQTEHLRKLLEWIKNLLNDLERLPLLSKEETEIEKLMEKFQTKTATMYISDIIAFIRKTKTDITKSLRRKLFLSLAQLEKQIENLVKERAKV